MAYLKSFYEKRHCNTYYSAESILSFIHSFYTFKSTVDFGCGTGTWLNAAKNLGALIVQGHDGPWVPKEFLQIKSEEFQQYNFEQENSSDRVYDLAISLEVAEHLSEKIADNFVKNLCDSAPVVLFGAAVPYQGGNGHINEQWLSYWTEKFQKQGLILFDVIRPHVWNDQKIPFWYKQNTTLYINPSKVFFHNQLNIPSFYGSNLIHPDLYKIRANPSLIERYRMLIKTPAYIFHKLKMELTKKCI